MLKIYKSPKICISKRATVLPGVSNGFVKEDKDHFHHFTMKLESQALHAKQYVEFQNQEYLSTDVRRCSFDARQNN